MKTFSLILLAACIIAAVSAVPVEENAPAALNPVEDVLRVQFTDQLTQNGERGERVKRGGGYEGYGGGGGGGGLGRKGGRGGGGKDDCEDEYCECYPEDDDCREEDRR